MFAKAKKAALIFVFIWFSTGCSGQGCGDGAFTEKPFPSDKIDKTVANGAQTRITSKGFRFFEGQVPNLLNRFLDNGLNFCVPKQTTDSTTICPESRCDNGDQGCQIDLEHNQTQIETDGLQEQLKVHVQIGGLEEKIPVTYDSFLGNIDCTANLHKRDAELTTPANVRASVPIIFSVDRETQTNKVKIDVAEIEADISKLGVRIENRGNAGDAIACGAAEIGKGLFRGLVEDLVKDRINEAVQDIAQQNLCRTCNEQSCPDGTSCKPLNKSDDEDENDNAEPETKICKHDNGGTCVPQSLGVEGQLAIGSLLEDFSQASKAKLDLMGKATDHADVKSDGLNMGLRAGFNASSASSCVPVDSASPPDLSDIDPSDAILRDSNPHTDKPFMVGLGIHQKILNHAFWEIWRSGALCLNIGSTDVSLLSTTTLGTFLPSLKKLSDGKNAARVQLAPQKPPSIELGANTISTDEEGEPTLDKPLLTLNWKKVDIHVYGFIRGRYVRVVTFRTDLKVPIALVPAGASELRPVFGDLENAVTKITPKNTALIAESDDKLKELVPTLLSVALPRVTSAIDDTYKLPKLLGYQLVLGERDITSVDDFLAIYTDIQASQPQRLMVAPEIAISEKQVRVDHSSSVPRPRVRLEVRLEDSSVPASALSARNLELRYRVDRGFWSPYQSGSKLQIDSPALTLQGRHRIDVQARQKGHPSSESEPITTHVQTDYSAPELSLTQKGKTIQIDASDAADSADELKYRHRAVGPSDRQTPWSGWHSNQNIDLQTWYDGPVPSQLKIQVQVRDRADNMTRRTLRFNLDSDAETPRAASGCQTSDGMPVSPALAVVFIGLFAAIRRRRKGLLIGVLVAACAIVSACDSDDPPKFKAKDNTPKCETQNCEDTVSAPDTSDKTDSSTTPECGSNKFYCGKSGECKTKPEPCKSKNCRSGTSLKITSRGSINENTCEREGAECKCEPKLGQHGEFVSIAKSESTKAIGAYNRSHGDMMVGILDGSSEPSWSWVDGVPGGQERTSPNRLAENIADPGTDVGTHTSIAIDEQGTIHTLYRDVENEAVKYAKGKQAESGGYVFESVTLDGAGDTGYFTDISVAGGTVYGMYAGYEVQTPEGNVNWSTQLNEVTFAVDADLSELAGSAEPTSIVSKPSANPCGTTCADDKSCFIQAEACRRPQDDSCDSDCGAGQACWEGECKKVFTTSPETHKRMTGMHADLDIKGQKRSVVFYDSVRGGIGWATFENGSWSEPKFIEGPYGPFASGAFDSDGKLHVAYMNRGESTIVYRATPEAQPEVVANGTRKNPGHLVASIGQDLELKIDSNGEAMIVFQDTTTHQIKLAKRSGQNNWSVEAIAGPGDPQNGVPGFYTAITEPSTAPTLLVQATIDNQGEHPVIEPVIQTLER